MKTVNNKNTVVITAFAMLTLLINISVLAQKDDNYQVISVVDAFHGALVAGDSTAALNYLAEDVVILESGGIENKHHYRSGHIKGDIRFAQAVPRKRGEITVTINGNVAWAYSSSVTQGKMGEREINAQGAELVVLAKDGGTWKIKAIHWSSRKRK